MKIRPIFKTIDIFSFIQFLSRQTNYIIKFFLLKVLYLVSEAYEREKDAQEAFRPGRRRLRSVSRRLSWRSSDARK